MRLNPYHPALRKARSIFPSKITTLGEPLKQANSTKVGHRFVKGPLCGMPIYALTLEERKTCNRACPQWRACYGNNMRWAQRQETRGLMRRLGNQLAKLEAKHPGGFAVRLHVLGDFFSVGYVEFWLMQLRARPALHVFGFTHRTAADPIGRAIEQVKRIVGFRRFGIRWSDSDEDCAANVVGGPARQSGVLCPAQTHGRKCANCAICLSPHVPTILFQEH